MVPLDRGLCYIQTQLLEGQTVGFTSLSQINAASRAIMDKCTANEKLQGGIARNIGRLMPQ